MLSEQRRALGLSPTNRTLQRCFVVVILKTAVNPIITQELSHDGGAVVVYCHVQSGPVGATL